MTLVTIIIILIIIYFLNKFKTKTNVSSTENDVIGGAVIKREKLNKVEISDEKKQLKKKVMEDRKQRKQQLKEISDDIDNYIIPKKYLDEFYKEYFTKEEIKFINNFDYKKPISQLINLADLPTNLKYRRTARGSTEGFHKYVTNHHNGQRKLLLCEMFFLTKIHELKLVKPESIVVYVGAGPGHHLLHLIKLFPQFQYHLYDTRFDEELLKLTNVKTHLQFFTHKDCEKYKDKNIIFISDIRHPSVGDFGEPSPAQNPIIIRDQKMQEEWVRIIKPYVSLLKFRLPWLESDQPYEYLDGQVYVQPYAPGNSTETRLLVTDPESNKTYSCDEYERKMFFVNRVLRHNYAHKSNTSSNYDFAYTKYICEYYKENIKSKFNLNDILKITFGGKN